MEPENHILKLLFMSYFVQASDFDFLSEFFFFCFSRLSIISTYDMVVQFWRSSTFTGGFFFDFPMGIYTILVHSTQNVLDTQ